MRKWRKKVILVIVVLAISILLIPYIISTRTPVKYAIKIEDVGQYQDCIIVKEAFHTGTGWEQIGDQTGLFSIERKTDVYLTGKTPPMDALGGYYNIFVCEVKHTGQFTQLAPEVFEKYEVVEWYPLYPVKRDTILPQWLYPREYLSKTDKIE